MTGQRKPENKCPKCGGVLSWKVVRDCIGTPHYNGLCPKCCLVLRDREPPQITEGKNLEKSGALKGVHPMDKRMLRLPMYVQLGALRQRMHPKGTEVYSPYCKKCKKNQMQYERKDGKYKCSVCGGMNE